MAEARQEGEESVYFWTAEESDFGSQRQRWEGAGHRVAVRFRTHGDAWSSTVEDARCGYGGCEDDDRR